MTGGCRMIRAYDEYGNIVDIVEWEKPKKSVSEYYCRRCGHDKRSIYHKVFSSCARHKRNTYNQGVLFNNYLNSMPDNVDVNSEYFENVWQDNYLFAEKTGNDILLETLQNIVDPGGILKCMVDSNLLRDMPPVVQLVFLVIVAVVIYVRWETNMCRRNQE